MTSLSSLLGLKYGIFLAGTSTRAPVLGLRPTRGLRWRVRKLPKPRISILSPDRRERTTLSKIVSTIISLSLRVSSARRETSSIKSALVMAFIPPEIGFRVKNRFTYSEIHTFPVRAGSYRPLEREKPLIVSALESSRGNNHPQPSPYKPNLYRGLPSAFTVCIDIQSALGLNP